jgi:hypothetical protein
MEEIIEVEKEIVMDVKKIFGGCGRYEKDY